MGNTRDTRVYRVRQLPFHLKECGVTASFLASIAPDLGAADNIRVFSLAQENANSKTATVSFKIIPSIFDNDREQWTLQAEVSCGRNIIVDTHFRGFTVLNEPQSCPHTVDCVAISGLASHPFGSWKHRESGSHFMWLRDRLPQDVPKLRSFIYGYDTKLFKSHSFQDLDDIASSFIESLKEIRRALSPARPLILLAHSLGGIVVKRALVLLAKEGGDEEKDILNSVKGLVFFGVPHKGMEISHLLAMVTKQPNEDLIGRTLSADSKLLSELDEQFANIALRLTVKIRFVYETVESQLTEQNPSGTWVRSETSYAVLVNKDSAIPTGTSRGNAIAVNKDHSNIVKFGEGDPVYQTVVSFVLDLSNYLDIQRDTHVGRVMSIPVQKSVGSFSTVPFPRDPDFVGRGDVLAQLDLEIANPISQRWASLYGLGGIGKSQIAIEYSYRRKIQYPETSTFWVHASSKARLEQSYAEIAAAAGILGVGDGKADVLQLVSNWLAEPDNGPWLLILDNADDETVLLDSPKFDPLVGVKPVKRRLLDYVPRGGRGTVLMTTRDRNCALKLAGYRGTPIEVTYMTLDESVDLLRGTLPGAHQEEASGLVKELGNVPLAISQASAYIKMVPPYSILSYLEIFRRSDENQAALLKEDEGDLRRDPGVSNAVITSWELSFNQIRKKSPRSAGLLSLMSYLNRQAIPQSLIQGDVGEILFHKDLAPLLSFSLIRAEIGEHNFEMHRLVQTAMRHWLQNEGDDQLWKERAIERVAGQFPLRRSQAERWSLCEVLMSHADEVLLYVTNSKDMDLSLADLLDSTAWYLSERRGNYGLAQERATLALQILKHHVDDDANEVLGASGTLAYAKSRLGQLDEARDLQESILKHRLEKSGPEHADTLAAMHNLAFSYEVSGLYEKAENQLKHVVEVRARVFGSTEHSDFLSSASSLANVQNSMGKHEEAEKQSARVLEISRRCLGDEHITTLNALHNLSEALLGQNKIKEAEDKVVLAMQLFEKVFGPSHFRTLGCRRMLADIYMDQEKFNEAEEIYTSCLDTAKEVYGLQNATTLTIMNQLALVYRARGNHDDALRLFRNASESGEIVDGPVHPETLTSIFNIALCYYDLGDKYHAISLMREVHEKQREVLPANHPGITKSTRCLAYWKAEQGGIDEKGIEDAESEEEGSEEEGSEEEGSEAEGSEEEEDREEESEEQVSNKDGNVEQHLARPQNSSLALRKRSQEKDHQGSDVA